MNRAGGDTLTMQAAKKITLTALSETDLSGAAGALNYLLSGTPGTQDTLAIPANTTIQYLYAKDQVVQSPYVITVSGGTNGGNNVRFIFPTVASFRLGTSRFSLGF
jgi:hypothetical protein